jgi:redox-sensitive bicupin YhaK (pirin superfamily)
LLQSITKAIKKAIAMSIHPNADASQADGVKVEAWGKFVSHQLGLAATSVVQLTVPAGVNQAIVQADGENLRFTLDGTTPTTAVGFVIPNGASITLSASDATNAKLIAVTSSGLVNAIYTL